jgi:exodeoxyribonuclease-3
MKIATFNVNGINGRLPVLLEWLAETQPDIACLQELKAPQERFPEAALREAGYGAVWHGQKAWNGVAILARGSQPVEIRRGLPGDPEDLHSRYLEAAVNGFVVGCLYLPNGNPWPGPRFDYKLRWFERLTESGQPAILAGDFNVMPTDLDVYAPERWIDDALFRPEVRDAFHRLTAQGWTDALRTTHPGEKIYTFWKYFRNAFARNAGIRIDHVLLGPSVAPRLVAAGVDRDVRGREKPAIMPLSGWKSRELRSHGPPRAGPPDDSKQLRAVRNVCAPTPFASRLKIAAHARAGSRSTEDAHVIKAVIFDIDGTLVDSVDLHARAWTAALHHFGHLVSFADVRSQIGKGGDQLMPVFLSAEEIENRGEEIEAYRAQLFRDTYLPQVRAFPAVRDLVKRIQRNGQRVALASSAKGSELSAYKKIAAIDDLIEAETTSDDVGKSKPHPDIFEAMLGRLRLDAREAVVIGDSPHDAQAASKIGLRTIGVLCGGFSDADLRAAGACAIYGDPAHLLRDFGHSLLALERPPERSRPDTPHPTVMLAFSLATAAVLTILFRRR